MASEIKRLAGTLLHNSTPRARAPEAGSRPDSAGSLNRSDDDPIKFTDTTVSLKKLESFLRQLPNEDEGRVGDIRDRIAAGLYKIDGTRVAKKLFAFEYLYHGANSHARFYASA